MSYLTTEEPQTLLAAAEAVARVAHTGQMYGDRPFIEHPTHVAALAAISNLPTAVRAAAWLHDVLEDSKVITESMLRAAFPPEVVDLVVAVTNEPGKNRRERHERTHPKTRANSLAVALKLCDRISNLFDARKHKPGFVKMYRKEYGDFCQALRREGEWESLWRALDNLIAPTDTTNPGAKP